MTPINRPKLLLLIQSESKRVEYRKRGKASVPGGLNACAATASQPFVFDLHLLKRINTMAEGLATDLKALKNVSTSKNRKTVIEGDLIVCEDADGPTGPDDNVLSDHVWFVVRVLGSGWYECFDNQKGSKTTELTATTYRRRLDGKDGKTPMRGRIRLTN